MRAHERADDSSVGIDTYMFYRRVCRFCLNTYAHVSVFFRYYSLLNSLDEFTATRIEEWGKDVESSSQAKLKLPLLRRDAKTRHLSVNFDSDLSLLLREVKYMLSLGLKDNIPAEILQLYEKEGTPVVTHGIRRSESFNFSRTLCSEQEQRS